MHPAPSRPERIGPAGVSALLASLSRRIDDTAQIYFPQARGPEVVAAATGPDHLPGSSASIAAGGPPKSIPPYPSPTTAKPPRLSRLLSDLVLDSKLDAVDLGTCIRHTFKRPGRTVGERFVTVEERWVREARLGIGAHGTVYRERLEGQETLRAVKEIKRSTCEELDYSRELEAIVKFSHPRVHLSRNSRCPWIIKSEHRLTRDHSKYAHCFVTSNGWFELGDSIMISMEHLPLGDLEQHLTQPLPEAEARLIVSQVLEGLGYMHSSGFVHRDVKPRVGLVSHGIKPRNQWPTAPS